MTKEIEIVDKYLNGESVISLAKEYSLSRERIYQYLRKLGAWDKVLLDNRFRTKQRRMREYKSYLPAIIEWKEAGLGTFAISRKLKLSYKTVANLLAGTKYDNRNCRNKARDRKILREYLKGKTQTQIAEEMGMKQNNISRILIKLNNGKLSKGLRERR